MKKLLFLVLIYSFTAFSQSATIDPRAIIVPRFANFYHWLVTRQPSIGNQKSVDPNFCLITTK